ncbi:pentatricopeptide repeat-containing protein-like [Iris pallida]|uniref:Pentatricopeptide repeat-containing protein-like n=1 Tax=Iris pallida TaxID=29817 RepID=A0AAX6DNE6_IRIPA|nr:pentatricopeptide repeat-containing protein-like [Iris pallida]
MMQIEEEVPWLRSNRLFQRHPRLLLLLRRPSLRSLRSILAHALVTGLFRNPFVASRLLHRAAEAPGADPSFAASLFSAMTDPNPFSFNTAIAISADPLSVYSQMLVKRVPPDSHTFSSLLNSTPAAAAARSLHAHLLLLGFRHDPFVQTALLTVYSRRGSADHALRVFDGMPHRDVVSWTAAVSGLVALGQPATAVRVFASMRPHAAPNAATVVSAVSASAGLGSLALARCLHAYVEKAGFGGCLSVRNSLVDSYAKCGSVACARGVFDRTGGRDLFSWTAMVAGLASHGLGREAVDVFGAMRRAGLVPDSTAFVAVLSACSHAGLVEEGVRIFDSMQTVYGIMPDIKHYGCMVDLYSRAGLLGSAYELLLNMPMEPNLVILGAFLSACRLNENLELAEIVTKKIESVCHYQGGAHVLLSNMYANKKQWHEVVSVREAARSGDGKPQGRSSIDVRGVVHEFGVEDRSHPLAREMTLVLNGLAKPIEGFVFL